MAEASEITLALSDRLGDAHEQTEARGRQLELLARLVQRLLGVLGLGHLEKEPPADEPP